MTGQALVLVASTRAASGVYEDTTGPVISAWLGERGWQVQTAVVADGPEVDRMLSVAVEQQAGLVITTGGTGLSPDDRTADATAALLDWEVPGLMEELRRRGAAYKATALLSRGHAGVAGSTFIMNLPGSPGAVRDGLALLDEVLDHLLDQLAGGKAGH